MSTDTTYFAEALGPTKSLQSHLDEAIEKLKEQDAFIKQVAAQPAIPGIVVAMHYGEDTPSVDVIFNGSMVRLPYTAHESLDPLDTVLIVVGGGIISRIDNLPTVGKIVTITQEICPSEYEVSLRGESAILRAVVPMPLAKGDRVVVDQTNTIILAKVPPPPAPVLTTSIERVEWEDIGGQAEAKQAITEAIIWPITHNAILAAYGQRPTKGLLFYGPSGCGKTMIAKAVATTLADEGNPGFFSVSGPDLMNPYVGETERRIRDLFTNARNHHEITGTRAVIFIDEADSCLGHRGYRLHSDISVPAFLVEMDGLNSAHQPLVILATNRPHDLDEAIIRDGRVDRKIEVKRPTRDDVKELLGLYLYKRPIHKDAYVPHMIEGIINLMETSPLWEARSGAMISGLVDRATAKAMQNDITNGATTPLGITIEDCLDAISEASKHLEVTPLIKPPTIEDIVCGAEEVLNEDEAIPERYRGMTCPCGKAYNQCKGFLGMYTPEETFNSFGR